MVNKTAGCNKYYTISAAAKSLGVKCFVENIRLLSSQSPFCDSYNLVDILQYGVPPFIMGCRQVVRHSTLTAVFAGSNPATPAKKLGGLVE